MNNGLNKTMKKTVILMSCILFSSFVLLGCQSASVNDPGFNSKNGSENNAQKSSQHPSNIQTLNAKTLSNLTLNTQTMMNHLNAFQTIAQQNGGHRAVASKGGQASAQYILNQLKKTAFKVQAIPFENRSQLIGQNIILEIEGENKEQAMIFGAHYDSVKMGPGINDNATGTALLLELANQFSKLNGKPPYTVYLAFWDSEEDGIGGSQAFVQSLSDQQLKNIKAYINVDMVGTKAPHILIADADKSSIDEMEKMLIDKGMAAADYPPVLESLRSLPTHEGDLGLETHLKTFFKSQNIKIKEDVSTLTASDTAPFLGKVPVTSIILFNERMQGDVLEFAPCYHQACDTIDWVDPASLELSAQAVVYLLNRISSE